MTESTTNGTSGALATEPPVAMRLEGVSKHFGGTRAVDDVSFAIRQGTVHALLGGNGSGKSTLIKIMAGVYRADAGRIHVTGEEPIDAARVTPEWATSAGLHFVHQAIGSFANMSVAENLAIGTGYDRRALSPVRWRQVNERARAVLERFELDIDPRAAMGSLGAARRTMVAVARALQHEDREGRGLLILDEPTASLPTHEVELVLETIRGYLRRGHTVLFVTHHLDEVLKIATHATFLKDGRHLETCALSGLDERSLVERIAGVEHLGTHRTAAVPATGDGTARLVLRDIATGPLEGLDLQVRRGETLGISGLLGSGRSTLLRAIFGLAPVRRGTIEVDGRPLRLAGVYESVARGIAYIPEDRAADAAFADRPVRENISAAGLMRYWRRLRIDQRREKSDARDAIDRYGVKVASCESTLSTLSGGNQQKVILARWLDTKPGVLLLDEPTQGVDVGARAAIHDLIRAAAEDGMAVICVSSDPRELAELCDRVVGLRAGALAGEITGDELTPRRCLELGYGLDATEHEEKEFA